MARRTLVWHMGLPHPARATLSATLEAHAEVLDGIGSPVVATAEEARLATRELLRIDPSEGHWARIADRVWAHRGVSLLSTPDLGAADKDQLRLALDPLIGVEVHLVLTADTLSDQLYGAWLAELRAGKGTGWDTYVDRVRSRAVGGADTHLHRQAEDFWAGHELSSVLARWGWTIHADRIHVVLAGGPSAQWSVFREVARIPDHVGAGLPVVVPPPADPAGVAVLRRVNRQLDGTLTGASAELLTRSDDSRDMPVADTSMLGPLLGRWEDALVTGGYDVRGDLRDLDPDTPAVSLPGPRDQLGVAVDALAEALADNTALRARVADLERDNARLDRKRRKHKRRLRRLSRTLEAASAD